MSNLWFISDTHFDHGNIIKHCDRPFGDWREMNAAMIDNWNDLVKPEDHIWHLGDFVYGRKRRPIRYFTEQLNGHIHLIIGGHDRIKDVEQGGLESYQYYKELRDPQHIVLFHYPLESWNGSFRGSIHLHGHCHGNLQHILPRRLDISVDSHRFRPINYDELESLLPDGEFTER